MDDSDWIASLVFFARYYTDSNYHIMAIATLGIYDWILSLGRERQYIWQRTTSKSSLFFLVIRYSSLATIPFTMIMSISFPGKSNQTCSIAERADMVLDILVLSAAAAYSAIRVYAIWGRRRWLLALVLVMGMMNPVVTASLFFVSSPDVGPPPFLDCGYDMDVSDVLYAVGVVCLHRPPCLTLEVIRTPGVIAARASSIIADTLVIVATLVRMWPMRSHLTKRKLTGVMFTDGSVYFIVLLGANVVALAFIEEIELTYLIAQWISCFTVIFTCRFILDLHEAAASPPTVMPATTRRHTLPGHNSSSMQFSDRDSESEPTLPVTRHTTGLVAKLDVSFGSMSIFGAMIPWIGTGESEGGATGDRDREAFLGLRDGSEDGSGHR